MIEFAGKYLNETNYRTTYVESILYNSLGQETESNFLASMWITKISISGYQYRLKNLSIATGRGLAFVYCG